MYRAMKAAADGLPEGGRSARKLGVRPGTDLLVQADGMVNPGTGGMSVCDEAEKLAMHRCPKSLGGDGDDPVFAMPIATLPASLFLRA